MIWTTGEAPQPPAEVALKWAKTEPKFKILGGYYEGSVLDMAGVEMLSKMPTKNDIRASMLMTFLAGPQSFVVQIAAAPTQLRLPPRRSPQAARRRAVRLIDHPSTPTTFSKPIGF